MHTNERGEDLNAAISSDPGGVLRNVCGCGKAGQAVLVQTIESRMKKRNLSRQSVCRPHAFCITFERYMLFVGLFTCHIHIRKLVVNVPCARLPISHRQRKHETVETRFVN